MLEGKLFNDVEELWVIQEDGVEVVMPSGKRAWTSRKNAELALQSALRRIDRIVYRGRAAAELNKYRHAHIEMRRLL